MAKGKISAKQEEILEYIKAQTLQRGYPPAVREICDAVHLKSTSSVHSHLETLEKNGYIRRDPTKPRAIEIIDDEFNLARREIVNVPVIGEIAAGEFQIPCQAWVEKYAVIVLDDYIWDIPSKIYGERADKYFSRFKQHVYINQSESDYIITPRLKGALSRV